MLDVAGIIFSSMMMLMVIIRAIRMDRVQPWFQTIRHQEQPAAQDKRAWQRQSRMPLGH